MCARHPPGDDVIVATTREGLVLPGSSALNYLLRMVVLLQLLGDRICDCSLRVARLASQRACTVTCNAHSHVVDALTSSDGSMSH